MLRRPQGPLTATVPVSLSTQFETLCCDPRQSQPTDMKTADVPYAADAEVSLTFDELQVRRYFFYSF